MNKYVVIALAAMVICAWAGDFLDEKPTQSYDSLFSLDSSDSEDSSINSPVPSVFSSSSVKPPVHSSSVPVKKSSSNKGDDDDGDETNVGMIIGIVVAAIVVIILIVVVVWCIATNGKKHGKVDSSVFEDETEFISMSVL